MILCCHTMYKTRKKSSYSSLFSKLKQDLGKYTKRKTKLVKYIKKLRSATYKRK